MYNTDGNGKVWDRETGEIVLDIPMKQFNKWIAALRSGKYKQTRGRLQDGDGFCCLGVLCDSVVPKNKLELMDNFGWIYGHLPHHQDKAPSWVKKIDSIFTDISAGSKGAVFEHLYDLNDTKRLSFNEIADILELTFKECAFNK